MPVAFIDPVADPLGDLVGRYARTQMAVHDGRGAEQLGLPPAAVADTLARLAASRRVVEGESSPVTTPSSGVIPTSSARSGADRLPRPVLRPSPLSTTRASRGSSTGSTSSATLAECLRACKRGVSRLRGTDGVATVLDQLAGCRSRRRHGSHWSLPVRVVDYAPSMLDELLSTGEVVWSGHGAIGPLPTAGGVPPRRPHCGHPAAT